MASETTPASKPVVRAPRPAPSAGRKPGRVEYPDTEEIRDAIKRLNDQYFVLRNYGGHCLVGELVKDRPFPGEKLHTFTFEDFSKSFLNQRVRVGGTDERKLTESIARIWLESPERRQYDSVEFAPERDLGPNFLNLWRGWPIPPAKGDCSIYLDHLYENICRKDNVKFKYLLNWMAYTVQHPDEQGHTAIVISGKKGVGKNVAAEGFCHLFGQHGMVVPDSSRLTNHFNAHLQNKICMVADEATLAGGHAADGILKHLVTGGTLEIEKKGVDIITARNHLHLIILGNASRLVKATRDERRYLVMQAGDDKRKNLEYFAALQKQLQEGGYAALLYHLLHEVELADFNVRQVPWTRELKDLINEGLGGPEALWYGFLVTGDMPGRPQKDGTVWVSTTELLDYAGRQGAKYRYLKAQHLGKLFSKDDGLNYGHVRDFVETHRLRFWAIPTLAICRQHWDDKFAPGDWHNVEDWKTQEWSIIQNDPKSARRA